MKFELARKVADAVLYEGYVLYPYRASALKNRFRWQFGLVAPRAWSEAGGEPWEMQTECLIEPLGAPVLDITLRFLRLEPRTAEDGAPWEEGTERRIEIEGVSLARLASPGMSVPFDCPGEGGRITGRVLVSAEPVNALFKLRVRVENLTDIAADVDRRAALLCSLAGAHTLLSVGSGRFLSLTDPPAEAKAAAETCVNVHTWPVLMGREDERDVILSSPIILQDYPATSPESPGDFCDATEIDEMLALRVMTLTDEEKREARATGERSRSIVDRADSMPPEVLERLHGAIRSLGPAAVESFFNPPGEVPEEASVEVGSERVSRGTRVRLAPNRRSDSMDFFLSGRTARVEAVHRDVEGRVYVAVTVDDDPAADLHGRYGRFYYFYPDELKLVET